MLVIAVGEWYAPDLRTGGGMRIAHRRLCAALGRAKVRSDTEVKEGSAEGGVGVRIEIDARNGAIVRIGDLGTVSLGATNYDSSVSFNGKQAVYIGIQVAPSANLLTVVKDVKKTFTELKTQLPQGLNAQVVFDASSFVNSSIHEVIKSLFEALLIVTIVIFEVRKVELANYLPALAVAPLLTKLFN